ncbi:RNA polymerase II-associated 1 [Hyphodiscus hymeniophilus]|uniref:RNA polymerase II-associated 1 n=1 Tax=Hyphodiscus hymeniophilus TaxID=353542 RepID=A0A9P6VI11_9HELO|nr:RNA polymerase II-associated 1 [Hyphodiscus hymeniophilus]
MASSAPRGADRMIHQDYIARIRYSNALPPPPNPPKLLDIPNTGLASGQYTTPSFASRLSRDQPLNIEADAELGMPLDLVGMPGIFDGDESSIQAPLQAPVPHPHDRALLRPLSTLGKPKFSDTGVSFLRRTEYISSYTSKSRFDSTTSRSLIDSTGGTRVKKPAQNVDRDSPSFIKGQIEKSFAIAASNIKNPTQVRHPTNPSLKVVSAHQLLPDLDAFPDAGGYITIKFLTNPVPPSNTYDVRLENGLLKPLAPTDEEQDAKDRAREEHERDPDRVPAPVDTIEYELFLTESQEQALTFKRKFDMYDPEKDNEELYPNSTAAGQGCFRFKRIRAYESAHQTGSILDKYDSEVMIAVHDGSDGHHQKAAYYYPIVQKTSIRPQRTKNIQKQKMGFSNVDEDGRVTDFVDMRIEDPDPQMIAARDVYKTHPYGKDEPEPVDEDAPAEEDSDGEAAKRNVDADGSLTPEQGVSDHHSDN